MRLLLLILTLLLSNISIAEVNIDLLQVSKDNKITVSIINNSEEDNLYLDSLSLKIFSTLYVKSLKRNLKPAERKSIVFYVDYPKMVGTYVQKAVLTYVHENNKYSLSNVGFFNYQKENGEWLEGGLGSHDIFGPKVIYFDSAKFSSKWDFHFPTEVLAVLSADVSVYTLTPQIINRATKYPIFASVEIESDGQVYSKIATGRLRVEGIEQQASGYVNNYVVICLLLFIIIFYMFNRKKLNVNTNNYISKLVLVLGAYLLTNNVIILINIIIGALLQIDSVVLLGFLAEILYEIRDTINTKFYLNNYKYYLQYLIDPLLVCFISYFTVQMYLSSKVKIESKYGLLIQEISDGKLFSLSSLSRTALRAYCLKLIFIPFLASWVIQNINHIEFLYANLHKIDLWFINKFLLASIFLVDSFIFLQGYCIESNRLKNNIISVDSSKLGWFVCLICYPPLNYYVFTLVDFKQTAISIDISLQFEIILTIAITFLWLIFVIASLNLGFKASNLTNRGVVDRGLYKYCRHPAYSAKMMIWLIQTLFLGTYFLSFFIALCVVYILRAYTEERHLIEGQEYKEYIGKVKYRFIPGVV
jgi:protein-S-isoprenylcysteine O-methyltransferase Ste14